MIIYVVQIFWDVLCATTSTFVQISAYPLYAKVVPIYEQNQQFPNSHKSPMFCNSNDNDC